MKINHLFYTAFLFLIACGPASPVGLLIDEMKDLGVLDNPEGGDPSVLLEVQNLPDTELEYRICNLVHSDYAHVYQDEYDRRQGNTVFSLGPSCY